MATQRGLDHGQELAEKVSQHRAAFDEVWIKIVDPPKIEQGSLNGTHLGRIKQAANVRISIISIFEGFP